MTESVRSAQELIYLRTDPRNACRLLRFFIFRIEHADVRETLLGRSDFALRGGAIDGGRRLRLEREHRHHMDGVEQHRGSPQHFTRARKRSGGCYAIET